MHRRKFITLSSIGLIGFSSFGIPMNNPFSTEDLLGKGSPILKGNGYQLLPAAHEAFKKMSAAAAKENIQIKPVSSYRSYNHQHSIWKRKYKKFTTNGLTPSQAIKKIIEYSTIPGTSRHHWGTDIDIVDATPPQPKGLLLEKNFESNGPFCKLKEWLDNHANTFGFYLVYTNRKDRKGFKYEPWHYSYAPLSIPMLKAYRSLDIQKELQQTNLVGSDHFSTNFIQAYIQENILDINPKLL